MLLTLMLYSIDSKLSGQGKRTGGKLKGLVVGDRNMERFAVGFGETTAGSEDHKCLGIPLSAQGGGATIMWES